MSEELDSEMFADGIVFFLWRHFSATVLQPHRWKANCRSMKTISLSALCRRSSLASSKYLGDRRVKRHNFFSEPFLEQLRLKRSPEWAKKLSSSSNRSLLKQQIQGLHSWKSRCYCFSFLKGYYVC